ncbi:MAG: ribonuclease, partial [Acidobacteriota bacterium]
MTKELYVSSSPHETKVAVLEDEQLVEVWFERDVDVGIVGAIYKGRVSRVLPGMQSAFVDVGLERDAFLYVSDFYEESEEYERLGSNGETGKREAKERSKEAPPEAPEPE